MSFFNNYFERVYVLGLPALAQRRQNMERQMQALHIDYEYVEGIDGNDVSPAEVVARFRQLGRYLNPNYLLASDFADLEALRNEMTRRNIKSGLVLTPGALCAGLGHLEIIRRMLEANVGNALILEDDAVFADDVEAILRRTAAELEGEPIKGQWDMVVFGSCHAVAPTTPWKNQPDARPWTGIRPAFPANQLTGRRRIPGQDGKPLEHVFTGYQEWCGSHCYALSARCAQRLWSTDIMINPDGLRARVHGHPEWGLTCYVTHPFLAYGTADQSHIDKVNLDQLQFNRGHLNR